MAAVPAAVQPPAAAAEAPRGGGRKSRPCFRYGNYRGYYGYRVGAELEDHRLLALLPEWFCGRRCLDIGCNEGLVSLTLAVKFLTASFEGVDIDGSLVQAAQAKLRRLQRAAVEAAAQLAAAAPGETVPEERASLAAAAAALASTRYRRANFLELDLPAASVDTIVCLSVSKWVHLNWGDDGLLRLFDRCFDVLVPGGLLILEPQSWKSYRQALRKQHVRVVRLPLPCVRSRSRSLLRCRKRCKTSTAPSSCGRKTSPPRCSSAPASRACKSCAKAGSGASTALSCSAERLHLRLSRESPEHRERCKSHETRDVALRVTRVTFSITRVHAATTACHDHALRHWEGP